MSACLNFKLPSIVTAPASEPVTLAEAKLWLRVDSSDEDALITDLIVAAREAAEAYTRRSFITQTLRLTLDRFPFAPDKVLGEGIWQVPRSFVENSRSFIMLPRAPLQSVSSIIVTFEDDSTTTVAASVYTVDTVASRVFLKENQLWPLNLRDQAAIAITYIAGYGNAAAVPSSIKTAIKMHTMMMYESRSVCEMPESCMKLLQNYKITDRWVSYG